MKIWFDLSNSPHVNMFYDLIKQLEAEGHTIIITSRPLANTIELLNQKGLHHTTIGKHYGKSIIKKFLGYPIRILQLIRFLKKLRPEIAVSQSSFHSPIVAWLLNIPSIYTNDNEHALGNLPCFYLANRILIPENMLVSNVAKRGVSIKKIVQYPGVKEGMYLWSKGQKIHETRKRESKLVNQVYVRPEPRTAQYYSGKTNFLDDIIVELQQSLNITILPRDKSQSDHYSQPRFHLSKIADKPLTFDEIATSCMLFIGAGGSMTRELAILGISTISVYQDTLLDVDQFLIANDLMLHKPNLVADDVYNYIRNLNDRPFHPGLMNKGERAYELFKEEILNFRK